jgi:hypothetical protein
LVGRCAIDERNIRLDAVILVRYGYGMKLSNKIATAGLSTLGIVLLVLLILFLFGGYGFGGGYYYGPGGLLLIILLILLLTGKL